MTTIIIFGISGGIGQAIAAEFLKKFDTIRIYAPVRSLINLEELHCSSTQTIIQMEWHSEDEASLTTIASEIKQHGHAIDYCVSALGALHSDDVKPEKKLGQLSTKNLIWNYNVNAILHTLIIKEISGLMNKKSPAFMGFLSARVGSISDNKLGGWYSYRAAKAALNMIIRCAAIELKRYNKTLSIVGIHPGTVDTNLSKPFQAHVPEHKLFSADYAASKIMKNIIQTVSAEDSGNVFAYDGSRVPE